MDHELRTQHISNLQANPLELHTLLQLVKFPANKREILDVAYNNGIGYCDYEFLSTLPEQEYISFSHLLVTLEDVHDF